jgi:hypothetical protein
MVSMQSNSKGTTLVSPRVDSIGKVKTKEKREQLLDIDRTSTVPSYSSTNWLSQLANKAPKNTAGHKAKKARKMHEISGMPDNGRNYDLSTRVRDRLKSSSTDGRSLSCSSSDDTLYGGDRPQERARKWGQYCWINEEEESGSRRIQFRLPEVTTIAGGAPIR